MTFIWFLFLKLDFCFFCYVFRTRQKYYLYPRGKKEYVDNDNTVLGSPWIWYQEFTWCLWAFVVYPFIRLLKNIRVLTRVCFQYKIHNNIKREYLPSISEWFDIKNTWNPLLFFLVVILHVFFYKNAFKGDWIYVRNCVGGW